MKYLLIAIIALCSPMVAFCQDITGLWTGTLFNDSTQKSLPYEVFISKVKGKYIGYSQTWFMVNDIKYYGIKKINVRIAKDGKIVIQDAALMENNYPVHANKNVIQLDILNLQKNDNDITLDGPFVTNSTTTFSALTGRISIKRVASSNESSLMRYLNKNSIDNDITALK